MSLHILIDLRVGTGFDGFAPSPLSPGIRYIFVILALLVTYCWR